jgi:hypothetical protein
MLNSLKKAKQQNEVDPLINLAREINPRFLRPLLGKLNIRRE